VAKTARRDDAVLALWRTAGGGKTWLYCGWLLVWAYFNPGSRGFIARNELNRLMNSTYVTWTKVCAYHHIPENDWKLDGKYKVIRFANGSTIDLLDDFDRFGSSLSQSPTSLAPSMEYGRPSKSFIPPNRRVL
jgi:hypothetical protein